MHAVAHPMGKHGLLLDRDGILVDLAWNAVTESYEAPLRTRDVTLREGAVELIRAAHGAGVSVAVVSNQPGFAKGECTREALDDVHARIDEMLRARGAVVDRWYYCHHHPQALVPTLLRVCECRKPAPGMLLCARDDLGLDLASSWMVGDRDVDAEAGRRAGCRTLIVPHPRANIDRASGASDLRARDLFEGIALLGPVLFTSHHASSTLEVP